MLLQEAINVIRSNNPGTLIAPHGLLNFITSLFPFRCAPLLLGPDAG
ncbi:TPA: hypothetical protein L9L56_004481 [Klebsiella pneumoniae]|nr:hypothetical protein [Klebsiella pneumoniae]HBR1366657.1 hypothetical protein [Klebsiella pneumoniae]HBR2015016.1 hypothetical protein [Klebsiella pneumoniae]